jgi:hypothetical protein
MKWFEKRLDTPSKPIPVRYAGLELELLEDRSLLSVGSQTQAIIDPTMNNSGLDQPAQILPPVQGDDGGPAAAPTVAVANPGDQSNTEGDMVSLQVTATDQDNLPLNFSAAGLPAGLGIDPQSGLISGSILAGAAASGPYLATITATDGTSGDVQSFVWYVASAISITPMPDQQNTEGDQVYVQVTATDLNNLPLTFSADGLPPG